jgi:hypothetical protein
LDQVLYTISYEEFKDLVEEHAKEEDKAMLKDLTRITMIKSDTKNPVSCLPAAVCARALAVAAASAVLRRKVACQRNGQPRLSSADMVAVPFAASCDEQASRKARLLHRF